MTESGREFAKWWLLFLPEIGSRIWPPATKGEIARFRQIGQAAFEAGRGGWISMENPPAQNGEYLIVEAGDLESSTADYRDGEWWTVRSYGQDCEERQLYSVIWWRDMPAVPAAHVRPAPPDSGDEGDGRG